MPGFTWQVPPEDAFPEVARAYVLAVERMVWAVVQRWAPEVANYMKDNAPWTDRTGNARQGLYTDPERAVGQLVRLWVSHGVDYGIYLELSNAGAYAIINPALDVFAHRIWQDIVRRLS